uniref:Uncharacterized protein n=1 Tax=Rhizophora mucronata TaxID=61149 RepID=A0A2P2L6M1_RHIMU
MTSRGNGSPSFCLIMCFQHFSFKNIYHGFFFFQRGGS